MKRRAIFLALFAFMVTTLLNAQSLQITGTVTSSEDGSPIPGVSVVVKGTTIGAITDLDGKYNLSVPQDAEFLIFSFVGMKTQEIALAGQSVLDIAMEPDFLKVDEVVVTALGIKREAKKLPYAAQEVKAEELNITSTPNLKNALVGKVAGVQIVGQAGSKLGSDGRIRIRGAVSMTTDADPLYVVDGVPVDDPNVIDMENVASVNVLKGPNATALYGQRAEYGVIMITTKRADKSGVTVEINSNTTFDQVSYLPNYQNLYGQGYDGEDEWITMDYAAGNAWYGIPYPEMWQVFDGEKYIANGYADESWGPKFDGSDYIPWYAWWPDSPYYGQTAKWEGQPDNIKNFYDTGVTLKNSVAISGASDKYNARVSYTNLDQGGIIPESYLKKNLVNANLMYKPNDKFTINGTINYSSQEVSGDFDDGYSNQTTGSFNSWFARNVDTDKLRELVDLQTEDGSHASWNYWGPELGLAFGTQNGAFWYNPYFWLKHYKVIRNTDRFVGSVDLDYQLTDKIKVSGRASTSTETYKRYYEKPFIIENSADPSLYNVHNSGFGNYDRNQMENIISGRINYADKFGDLEVEAMLGGEIRNNSYYRFNADMETDSKTQGLVIPDVFTYSNAKLPVTAETYKYDKQVNSVYGKLSLGYRNLAFLDLTGRKDYSSALPAESNGYFYPSVGATFLLSEVIENDFLSFAKLRAGWAQVGNDVSALLINPTYPLSGSPYFGLPQMYTNTRAVDPDIKPSLNSSMEFGFDTKFMNNLFGVSLTYFSETRQDEIIPVSMSTATGYSSYLTNAGESVRNGVEIVFNATPVRTSDLTWDFFINFSKVNSEILELPGDLKSMEGPGGSDDWDFVTITHELDGLWGQLRGRRIARDDNGNKIINAATGQYVTESGYYYGSILPDFTGGFVNTITFKNMITLSAGIDFQKGGKFFSLTEMWGAYSGLTEETAAINNNGMNIRDAIEDGGGVHVTGVDTDGNAYDDYLGAVEYFAQFQDNSIAEPYVHNADYIKLRDVSISFRVPKNILSSTFIKDASIGFVGRNLWLISVADDNVHGWDPSELSQPYGENAQLPGTKSYGFNVKLTF